MARRLTEDQEFWMGIRSILLSLVALIEKTKLRGIITTLTSDLRRKTK